MNFKQGIAILVFGLGLHLTLPAQDAIDTLIAWPLDQAVNDSYDSILYDVTEIDTAIYTKGAGLGDFTTPDGDGGHWNLIPTGYIGTTDYFEINFSAISGANEKWIEITEIEFDASTRIIFLPARNFYLAYSLNSDFSNSTVIYDFPEGDISTASIPSPASFQYTFETPIVVEAGDVVYFRFYPYNAANFGQMYIIKNTFLINGIVRDQSAALPVENFSFSRDCIGTGSLSWDTPAGYDPNIDTIVVFAKKTDLIDQGSPVQDPSDYDPAVTNLDTLDTAFGTDIEYENDDAAVLVYRGTETSVALTNFAIDTNYYFVAFVVDSAGDPTGQLYSNGAIVTGSSSDKLETVSDASALAGFEEATISWTIPTTFCGDSVMVVCNTSLVDSTVIDSAASVYALRDDPDFTGTENGFQAATDFSEGRIVYVGTGSNVTINNLTNGTLYYVTIWKLYNDTIWSPNVNLKVFPDEFEVIITQTKSVDPDFVEFLTLKEIDFSTAEYNLTNYSVCESGKFSTSGSNVTETEETFFNGLDTIPAGTFIRVFSGTGDADANNTDGVDTLYASTSLTLNQFGGDQVILAIGDLFLTSDCSGSGVNEFRSALNYGNQGWITSGDPDGAFSWEPPSASNLEMPAAGSSYPNWTFKDLFFANGDATVIHNDISAVNDNWALGDGTSPAIRLKNIQFDSSNVSGSVFAVDDNGDIDISFKNLEVSDSVDVRYMVIAHPGEAPDEPVDRYTCYIVDSDYSLADSVVTAVIDQYVDQDPCGTPTAGNGRVVYLSSDTTAFTITNAPCGSNMFISVYALKGNGVTAHIGTGVTESVLLSNESTNIFYSQRSDDFDKFLMWRDQPGVGNGSPLAQDFTDCINLVVQNGDTVTFNSDVLFGSLTIESGGRAIITGSINLTLTKDLIANDSLLMTDVNSKIIFGGLRQANSISGTGYMEFSNIVVNNTYAGSDKLSVQDNIQIIEGITFVTGDLEVTTGDTVTLASRQTSKAGYLGILPALTTVTGAFNVERFLPTIDPADPGAGGSGQGVGWRYIASSVSGATYGQVMDDFTCTGFTGSQYPNYTSYGFVWPNLQKYDETVTGNDSLGFDGDQTGVAPLGIRNRRDSSETLGIGEGVFAYIGPVEATYDFKGTPVTGDQDVILSYTNNGNSAYDGWNLVANPYPCAIDLRNVLATGSISNTVHIFDAESGTWVTRQRNPIPSVPQIIAAGQSFWAQCSTSNSKFAFEETNKSENANATFYKDDVNPYEKSLEIHLEMVSNTNYADMTIIHFNDEASNNYDFMFDAPKFSSLLPDVSGISTVISDYIKDVNINAIPELTADQQIPIKVNIRQAGEYTISFAQTGEYIIGSCLSLYDVDEDISVSVDMSSVYTFYSELRPENAPARFILTMSPPINVESTDATCFEGTEGSAVAMGVGAGPFTYSWYNANAEPLLEETTSGPGTIDGLSGGFYTVVVAGNDTECGTSEEEFFISQPAAYENAVEKIDPTCNTNDGLINVIVDKATTWNVSWNNAETGEHGAVGGITDFYAITSVGNGTWDITTTSECGELNYQTVLDDGNPVEADFTLSADTIYISDGGVATFTNTSINASNYEWWYSPDQELPDNSENGEYTYTTPGVYNVTLWAENVDGCYDIYDQEIVVMQTTGITELNHEFGIIRSYISYGNGQTTQYVIELEEAKNIQIELMNTSGQILYTARVAVNGETRIDLPVNRLSSGMYMVITLADGTRIDTQKLIVR